SFPFWFNQGKAAPVPEPKLTEKAKAAKTCILPKEEMRTEHMQLLEVWRQSVVRDAQRVYVAGSGKEYLMSLSNNCMDCHSNKADFCDRCHNYASVDPYCWDCHIYPEEKK
ncbi:MAG: sulfate reduction electron transfer complex DsrMKJOP subunit DsrJ, partial [Deltaproteobacteria bacterium]|nr:sulfate reduction electron transfer complex DsrMKJOP subunit DsrJ [Deltaproteobacteria bacterium]